MAVQYTMPGAALATDGRMGALTINGVSMICAAWHATDLKELWQGPVVRGQDRILPGVTGVKAYRRRATVTKHSIPFVVIGYVDRLGVAQANPYAGLEANVAYLRTNAFDPTNVGDGTVPSVLTMPSGATRTANIHVIDFLLGNQGGPIVLATLGIEIPVGVYA